MRRPDAGEIAAALEQAAQSHHVYEEKYLNGKRDRLWSGFYAAYVLGRCGHFTAADELSRLLEEVPQSERWAEEAARMIFSKIFGGGTAAERDGADDILFICPRCFLVSEDSGVCRSCGSEVYEFHPGDPDDPCRCPVRDKNGEIITGAPLWWIRCVMPQILKEINGEGKMRQ